MTLRGRRDSSTIEPDHGIYVVTYEVVISAPNADLKLKPGLTANVTIYTQERSGVLAVANKALRFTPTKETVGKDMKIVDCRVKTRFGH